MYPVEGHSFLQGDLTGVPQTLLEPAQGILPGRRVIHPQGPFEAFLGVGADRIEIDQGGKGGGVLPAQGIVQPIEVVVGPEEEDQDENQQEGSKESHEHLPTEADVWGNRGAILALGRSASQRASIGLPRYN
jgi:hypothetical protein